MFYILSIPLLFWLVLLLLDFRRLPRVLFKTGVVTTGVSTSILTTTSAEIETAFGFKFSFDAFPPYFFPYPALVVFV
jgi:hypothetical protein